MKNYLHYVVMVLLVATNISGARVSNEIKNIVHDKSQGMNIGRLVFHFERPPIMNRMPKSSESNPKEIRFFFPMMTINRSVQQMMYGVGSAEHYAYKVTVDNIVEQKVIISKPRAYFLFMISFHYFRSFYFF